MRTIQNLSGDRGNINHSPVVIHVPHASTVIPESERASFQCDLNDELF